MPDSVLLNKTYLKMAQQWANLSKAKRKKVGCLIVKFGKIISDGYNGTPRQFDNECEFETRFGYETKPEVLHAESNAITKLAMSTESGMYSSLYTTVSPCYECAKLIIQCRIIRVVYIEQYRDASGIELLKKADIMVSQLQV